MTGVPVLHAGAVRRWDLSTRPVLHGLVLVARALQALRLKTVVKRIVVPLWMRRVRSWHAKSLAPSATDAALWVLVAQPRAAPLEDATVAAPPSEVSTR